MASSRIDVFRMMLEGDPDNTAVMFGLAKEYEKAGRFDDMIEVLSDYLQRADDEGNAYGMLAAAYLKLGTFATWEMKLDWKAFLKNAFEEMSRKKVKYLILDIRGVSCRYPGAAVDAVVIASAVLLLGSGVRMAADAWQQLSTAFL